MGELDGRVAIVTGAGQGLGQAIADRLAAAGAHVAVFEVDAAAGEAGAAALAQRHGVPTSVHHVDVSSSEQVDAGVAAVLERHGTIDILVNNAGVSHVGPHTQDVTDEEWQHSIGVMQSGVFFCMRAVAPTLLAKRSGSVVNVSSIRGFSPNPGRMSYCAPKAAVLMMTQVAAGEWAESGVRVNAVSPGFQRTPMWERDVARGAIDNDFYENLVPMKRLGRPEEVGDLVVFLVSDRASYTTGANVVIDGAATSVPAG